MAGLTMEGSTLNQGGQDFSNLIIYLISLAMIKEKHIYQV